MLPPARLIVCHSWFFLFLCLALFFPVVAVGKVWLVTCSARGRVQKIICYSLLTGFFLVTHHQCQAGLRVTCCLSLLYPVSEVWEPVDFNKEGSRLRKVLASCDLNDWLLLVVFGLNWLHGIKPDFHFQSVFVGPPSKVQTMV